jgi:hypothetical protein
VLCCHLLGHPPKNSKHPSTKIFHLGTTPTMCSLRPPTVCTVEIHRFHLGILIFPTLIGITVEFPESLEIIVCDMRAAEKVGVVNPSGKASTQIPQLPLGDNSSPWGDNAICT